MTLFSILELISKFAIFVTLITLVYQVLRDRKARKIQIVMDLYNKWSSSSFNVSRTKASNSFYQALKSEYELLGTTSGDLLKIKVPISEIYKHFDGQTHFGVVEHFMDDLGRLADAKQLDKDLSYALFKDVVEHWRSIFEIVDWSTDLEQHDFWDVNFKHNLECIYKFWGRSFNSRKGIILNKLDRHNCSD